MHVERGAWWATDHTGGKSQAQLVTTHSGILASKDPMLQRAWWAVGVRYTESDTTEATSHIGNR